MTVVAIRDMSTGNAVTGESWQETKVFKDTDTLRDVLNWGMMNPGFSPPHERHSQKRITITRPHED